MATLVDVAIEGVREDGSPVWVAAPELAAQLAEKVAALDASAVSGELDELRVFCDMMLGRGHVPLVEAIVDAVADACAARPREVVSADAERSCRIAVGASPAPSLAKAAAPDRGRSWLALRAGL